MLGLLGKKLISSIRIKMACVILAVNPKTRRSHVCLCDAGVATRNWGGTHPATLNPQQVACGCDVLCQSVRRVVSSIFYVSARTLCDNNERVSRTHINKKMRALLFHAGGRSP